MASTVVSVRLENELLDWMKLEAGSRGLALGEYLRLMIARGALTIRAEEELDNIAIRVKQQILEAVGPLLDELRSLSGGAIGNGDQGGSESFTERELMREVAKRAVVAEQLLVKLYADKNKLSDVDSARKTGDQVVLDYVGGAEFRSGR